jgi:predicted nucleic acid-binding protein
MEGVDALRQTLAGLRLILVDTTVFSYHLFGTPRYQMLARTILEAVEGGTPAALTTTLTLAELLSFPAQAGDYETMRECELFLAYFPHLYIVPLDRALAREAARVHAETRLCYPDAVQVAAARLAEADALVTNDPRWRETISHPRVILLEDYTV